MSHVAIFLRALEGGQRLYEKYPQIERTRFSHYLEAKLNQTTKQHIAYMMLISQSPTSSVCRTRRLSTNLKFGADEAWHLCQVQPCQVARLANHSAAFLTRRKESQRNTDEIYLNNAAELSL